MSEENSETVNVESIKTPKGVAVPTVKGMETVVKRIYSDLIPIVEANSKIAGSLEKIEASIQKLENRIEGWEKFLISNISVLGKISGQLQNIENHLEQEKTPDSDIAGTQKEDLLVIRDNLAELLVRLKAQLFGEEL
ncbi:MAG: hypothetical protein ACFFBD_22095 [Candidatus Hodarchaeota archaeon]